RATTVACAPTGPVRAADVDPKMPTVGMPSAAATCIAPESLPANALATESNATSSPTLVSPATTSAPARLAAPTPSPPPPPRAPPAARARAGGAAKPALGAVRGRKRVDERPPARRRPLLRGAVGRRRRERDERAARPAASRREPFAHARARRLVHVERHDAGS